MGVVSALGNSRQEITRSIEQERVCFRRSGVLSQVVAPVDAFDVLKSPAAIKICAI